ncbi:serine hydrolase domain-containing protein [uncultured Microbacterium sp.]|uniref:serine hydrolase domain-containing protein n=1 Tax=uncultured Microbacterium sp. TaxID=191216 RepID=UPI0028D6D88E|nr:serine hydrolase domain-containing protein [uncultured Microbacterium sp.]
MGGARRTRARSIGGVASMAVALLLLGCTAPDPAPTPTPTPTLTADAGGPAADPAEVAAIQAAVEDAMEKHYVRAAIVRVLRGDEVVLMQAWGESMSGVPATTDMHFRSGAVSIPMVSTVLLQLVDEGTVTLDDKLATWMPDVPNADRVTLGQLSQMTSGYADYVQDATFLDDFNRDPFRQWTPEELYTFGTSRPLLFEPGTNWGYAHTNYVLLALALEKITGKPMIESIQERIFEPLGMEQTADPGTPEILQPVLHAFDSERREYLQVAEGLPYIEDSTYWNPSWSLGPGSIQNTDITDMATTLQAIGRGDLVSAESFEKMTAPTLRGKTTKLDACPNTCFVQNEFYTYGLGIVLSGDWLLQNPQYHGFAGVSAYLPSEDVTIAIAATYADDAFDPSTGAPDNSNIANPLFTAVAGVVAPDASTPGT